MSTILKLFVVIVFIEVGPMCLQFNRTTRSIDEKVFIERLYSLIKPVHTTCLGLYQTFHGLLKKILEESLKQKIPISIQTPGSSFPNYCESILLFTNSSDLVCDVFSTNKLLYLVPDVKIVIADFTSSVNLSRLEECSWAFHAATLLVLTSQSEEVRVSSSPLFSSRKFTSVNSYKLSSFNLQGRLINVATFHCPPFVIVKKTGSSVEFEGVEMNLWKQLSTYLNITWKLAELKGLEPWGVALDNGTVLGGVIQALRDGDADVLFCNFWQTNNHLNIADFGPSVNKVYVTFLVRRPQKIMYNWQSLIATFTTEVWLTVVTTYLITSFVYWCACQSWAQSRRKTSLLESFFTLFGVLVLSSYYVNSSSASSKLVIIIWYMFTILFTTAFTSSIVTRLSFLLYTPRINTMQQLVEGNYYWSDSGYLHRRSILKEFYFDLNNSWQKMFETTFREINSVDLENCIENDPKLILPAQQWGKEYVTVEVGGVDDDTDLSGFRALRSSTREVFTSFAFRKGMPFNELFVKAILRFMSHGLWSYLKNKVDEKSARKDLLAEKDISLFDRVEVFTLQKLYPAFFVLAVGNVFACVSFMIEFCCVNK